MPQANSVVVLDFETTGLSPNMGDRAIEIGAVKIVDGEVVDSFQQLMNPGFRVSSFIEGYTGITNNMLRTTRRSISAFWMRNWSELTAVILASSRVLYWWHNALFKMRRHTSWVSWFVIRTLKTTVYSTAR